MNSLIKKNDYVSLVQQGDGNFRVTVFPRLAYDIYATIHNSKDKTPKRFLDTWIVINSLEDAKELYKMYSLLGDLNRRQVDEEEIFQSIRDIQNAHHFLKNKILSKSMTDMIHDDIPIGRFLDERNITIAGTIKTDGKVFTKDEVLKHELEHKKDRGRQRFYSFAKLINNESMLSRQDIRKNDSSIVQLNQTSSPGFYQAISAEKVSYIDKELFALEGTIRSLMDEGEYTKEQHDKMVILMSNALHNSVIPDEENLLANEIVFWLELKYRPSMFFDKDEEEIEEPELLLRDSNNVEGIRREEEFWKRNEDQGWLLSDVSQTELEKLEDILEEIDYNDGFSPEQRRYYEWSQDNSQTEWRMKEPEEYEKFLRDIWDLIDDSRKISA
jgi:hypothetical protein